MITLYVKVHRKTGLKYFGKTTKNNASKYKGSGIHWKRHIKHHGNDVDTIIVAQFECEEECEQFALAYSELHNIVESPEWANLKEENGKDGSPKGVRFSDSHREKIRQNMLGVCNNDFDDVTRAKMSVAAKNRAIKQTSEGKNIFQGAQGRDIAKRRNMQLIASGKHNFLVKGLVSVINKNGVGGRITKQQFDSQKIGSQSEWEYVSVASKEYLKRKGIK